MFRQPDIPDQPPGLQDTINMSDIQIEKARNVVGELSVGLDNLPVVLSQNGDVIVFAGRINDEMAGRIASQIQNIWQEGATRTAREFIRFEEELFEDEQGRANYMIYSVHIMAALTLTIGWEMTFSLTQIRAEAADAKDELQDILG